MSSRAPTQLSLFDPIRSRPIVRDRDARAAPDASAMAAAEALLERAGLSRQPPSPPARPLPPSPPLQSGDRVEPETHLARGVTARLEEADPVGPEALAPLAPPPRPVVLARAEVLATRLSRDLGMRVRLAVTDNRSTMLSFKRNASALSVRLHHMFLDAPEDVVQALADYAGRGARKAGPVLDAFIHGMQPRIRQERNAAEAELEPRGRCFDLQELYDRVNAAHFDGRIVARIGWGRHGPKRRKKSIRLGVYDHQTREIRIHPALDRPEVPRFFVEYIVFHEMLHQLFPSPPGASRRIHHPRAFRERERAYPQYAAAVVWEKENLKLLLRG